MYIYLFTYHTNTSSVHINKVIKSMMLDYSWEKVAHVARQITAVADNNVELTLVLCTTLIHGTFISIAQHYCRRQAEQYNSPVLHGQQAEQYYPLQNEIHLDKYSNWVKMRRNNFFCCCSCCLFTLEFWLHVFYRRMKTKKINTCWTYSFVSSANSVTDLSRCTNVRIKFKNITTEIRDQFQGSIIYAHSCYA